MLWLYNHLYMVSKYVCVVCLPQAGKFKYEYDSDKETEWGTWEHCLRLQEMEGTQHCA
jgi:splicing factor 4